MNIFIQGSSKPPLNPPTYITTVEDLLKEYSTKSLTNEIIINSSMGTNFYLRRKIPDKKIYELCNMMWDGKYESVRNFFNDEEVKDIHIGKRSYGWRFLWDHNNFKYFDPTVESIHEFLQSGWIVDEYGQMFTLDQFLEDEIKYALKNGITLREYYIQENGKDYLVSYEVTQSAKHIKEEIYRHLNYSNKENLYKQLNFDETGEFSIGNYRFSGHTDFS